MLIKHYNVEKIAHSSYIIAGENTCAVVDPRRDSDLYISEANKLNVKITHILETHLHADFISGHMDLANKTDAKIYISKTANADFEHVALKENDIINVDDMKIKVIETPGHTPEHISYIVSDLSRGDEPVALFCGDTLLVGDVGRPDLFPNIKEELAEKLYYSLFDKIIKLPDFCEIYPAHSAGSLCGKALGAKYSSTIGYEKKYNPMLQIKDKNKFIHLLTNEMPGVPDYFGISSETNRKGPTMLKDLPKIKRMNAENFYEESKKEDTIVVDVRNYDAFGGMHIPGAYNIDFMGNLPVFAGWILPYEKRILVVASNFKEAEKTVIWLRRVGIDNVVAYLQGGMSEWVTNGLPIDKVTQITPKQLIELQKEDAVNIIDTREKQAYLDWHIQGSINIPTPELRHRYKEIDKQKPAALICNSGKRSSLGVSILKMKGYDKIYNVAGGTIGYEAYIKSLR